MARKIDWTSVRLNSLPKSREEALTEELKHYFDGKLCPHGHHSPRIARTGVCFECKRISTRKAAERRRRKRGQGEYVPLGPLEAGARSQKLTATGGFRRVREAHKTRTYTVCYDEVICECGETLWIKRAAWSKQASCWLCSQREKSKNNITHGYTTGESIGSSKFLLFTLFHSAKKRAKRKGIEFSIELSELDIPAVCPVLGISLESSLRASEGNRSPRDNAPSLDRIDCTRGYVKGNVAVISHRANLLKKDGTAAEHELVAEFLEAVGVT